MSVYGKGFLTVLAVSIVLIVIAIPLALRKIPPNVFYGFRTRATLANDEIWYAANAHFARRLIAASVCGILLVTGVYLLQPVSPELFLPLSVLILAAPSLAATLATLRHVRALERAQQNRPGA